MGGHLTTPVNTGVKQQHYCTYSYRRVLILPTRGAGLPSFWLFKKNYSLLVGNLYSREEVGLLLNCSVEQVYFPFVEQNYFLLVGYNHLQYSLGMITSYSCSRRILPTLE